MLAPLRRELNPVYHAQCSMAGVQCKSQWVLCSRQGRNDQVVLLFMAAFYAYTYAPYLAHL